MIDKIFLRKFIQNILEKKLSKNENIYLLRIKKKKNILLQNTRDEITHNNYSVLAIYVQ